MAKRTYRNDAIEVHWDSSRCIHTGICTSSLAEVFSIHTKPWVTIDGADADAIAATVEACPSGALTYRRFDGGPQEATSGPTTVTPQRNGPLLIRGDLEIHWAGAVVCRTPRVALCRCGGTANPPFCDLTHRKNGFRDAEAYDPIGP